MKRDNTMPGLGIRFQPAGFVYVHENHGDGGVGRDLYTAVVQSQPIGQEEPRKAAQQFHTYQTQGMLEAYDFQFQTHRYLDGSESARDTTLMPRNALVVTRRTLPFQGLPDRQAQLLRRMRTSKENET